MNNSKPDEGAKRAAEVSDAMLGIPGIADDTLFFVLRYMTRCKVHRPSSLRVSLTR